MIRDLLAIQRLLWTIRVRRVKLELLPRLGRLQYGRR